MPFLRVFLPLIILLFPGYLLASKVGCEEAFTDSRAPYLGARQNPFSIPGMNVNTMIDGMTQDADRIETKINEHHILSARERGWMLKSLEKAGAYLRGSADKYPAYFLKNFGTPIAARAFVLLESSHGKFQEVSQYIQSIVDSYENYPQLQRIEILQAQIMHANYEIFKKMSHDPQVVKALRDQGKTAIQVFKLHWDSEANDHGRGSIKNIKIIADVKNFVSETELREAAYELKSTNLKYFLKNTYDVPEESESVQNSAKNGVVQHLGELVASDVKQRPLLYLRDIRLQQAISRRQLVIILKEFERKSDQPMANRNEKEIIIERIKRLIYSRADLEPERSAAIRLSFRIVFCEFFPAIYNAIVGSSGDLAGTQFSKLLSDSEMIQLKTKSAAEGAIATISKTLTLMLPLISYLSLNPVFDYTKYYFNKAEVNFWPQVVRERIVQTPGDDQYLLVLQNFLETRVPGVKILDGRVEFPDQASEQAFKGEQEILAHLRTQYLISEKQAKLTRQALLSNSFYTSQLEQFVEKLDVALVSEKEFPSQAVSYVEKKNGQIHLPNTENVVLINWLTNESSKESGVEPPASLNVAIAKESIQLLVELKSLRAKYLQEYTVMLKAMPTALKGDGENFLKFYLAARIVEVPKP